MLEVLTQITIHQPIDEVARYAADPDNAPEWYENIKSVEWKTPKPLLVGSQIIFKAHFLGKQLTYTYKIIQFVPSQILVMRTAEGPFPMETTYTWETAGNSLQTRMTLRNRGNPSGFSRWISPFMKSAIKRANKKDLQYLKQILEHSE